MPDYEPDVRGLAVSFELPDGSRTDIFSQTLPRFPFRDQEGFFAALADLQALALGAGRAARLRCSATRARSRTLPEANRIMGQARDLRRPLATTPFTPTEWIDADGGERYVRYTWRPTVDEPEPSREEAKRRGAELPVRRPRRSGSSARRCGCGWRSRSPATATIPTIPPTSGPTTASGSTLGTLEVTGVDAGADDAIVFDPMRVTDGIEPSDDPVLHYRPPVYDLSYRARTGG